MEWAECGSLDDLIDLRQGKKLPSVITTPSGGLIDDEDENDGSKSARIRAFKAAKQNQAAGAAGGQARRASTGASAGVHLLSVDEIKSFFSDIVSGLAFLVSIVLSVLLYLCIADRFLIDLILKA
jgi:hypothetical protein